MAEFGTLSYSVSLKPTSAFPLDARCYFESLAEAQAAASKAEEAGSTNTIYYFGQKLVVVTATEATWYTIQTNKTLKIDTANQDLSGYAKISDIPTKVSQLANDAGYLTNQDLSGYAKTSDLPTKVSQLANDAGYLTNQDFYSYADNYYTKSETEIELDKKQDLLTSYVESINGYSGKVTLSAADIHALPDTTFIPTVPTIISAFTNDADYATRKYVTEVASGKCQAYTFDTVEELDDWLKVEENVVDLNNGDVFYIRAVGVPDYWWDKETQTKQILETTKVDLTDYAKTSSIPTTVSQLINDANFITVAGVDTKLGNYQEKLTSYVSSVNGKSGTVSLTCTDIGAMPANTFIPTVPTVISAFTNDVGYAKTSDLPTKVSQLANDQKFMTKEEIEALIESIVLEGYLAGYRIRVVDDVNDGGMTDYITVKKV